MRQNTNNQQGFVSIIVVMVIMIFVTLLAVGFAFLARQNSHQSLDSQLSTQAFYAAESGVNDAIKSNAGDTGSNCGSLPAPSNPNLDTTVPVKYTCVLVNREPTNLPYQLIPNQSKIVHITTSAPIGSLAISWQGENCSLPSCNPLFASNNGTFQSKYYLPQKPFIGTSASPLPQFDKNTARFPVTTPVIRATVLEGSAITTDDNMMNTQMDLLYYPRAIGSLARPQTNQISTQYFRGDYPAVPGIPTSELRQFANADTAEGFCNNGSKPEYCNAQLLFTSSPTDIWLRLESVYDAAQVEVQVFPTSIGQSTDGGALPITGAQEEIDATGRAGDTIRRIDVRVPLNNDYTYPEFALESANTICKSFSTAPGVSTPIAPSFPTGDNPYTAGPSGTTINSQLADTAACALP